MLRVATWNLWCRSGDWPARQPAIESALRTLDADVVGLQEVSTREPDQPAMLRDALGYHVVAAPEGGDDRYGIANAIASRWPIAESGWEYLDVGHLPPHRTMLWATIDAPVGLLRIVCTHLSHGFDQSALRRRQLARIAELVDEQRRDPTAEYPPVLLGDLNAVPESDEVRRATGVSAAYVPGLVFTDAWAQAGDGPGVTYSAANPHVVDSAWPERRLDYAMIAWPRPRPLGNPVAAWRFGIDPVDGVVPSDHYGVAVELAT